jgi:5-methyltetrahydropteroyltriglutamate--homocysteine methyltransferase
MSGFGGTSHRPAMTDVAAHPDFAAMAAARAERAQVNLRAAPAAVGPVSYTDTSEVDAECALLAGAPFADTFMTAASPGIVVAAMENRAYATTDEYLQAVGAALAHEYRRIHELGLLLQIDAPDLALERHVSYGGRPLAEFLGWVEAVVAAINVALAGVAPARVRLHVCWGNYEGPHTDDVPLAAILDRLYDASVGCLVLSMANPRHAHEFGLFRDHPLPAGWKLVAGVVDTTSNYVEHPEVVADRLERIAGVLGDPRRLIAGTDCGFDTSAGIGDVAPSIVWEKLAALRQGADLATARLY